MISFNSYGEWKEVRKNDYGSTYYIDFDTIKEHGGHLYFSSLTSFLKPNAWGDKSVKISYQRACGTIKYKQQSYIFYKQPMGRGIGETSIEPNPEWNYPETYNVDEIYFTNRVCNYYFD